MAEQEIVSWQTLQRIGGCEEPRSCNSWRDTIQERRRIQNWSSKKLAFKQKLEERGSTGYNWLLLLLI